MGAGMMPREVFIGMSLYVPGGLMLGKDGRSARSSWKRIQHKDITWRKFLLNEGRSFTY